MKAKILEIIDKKISLYEGEYGVGNTRIEPLQELRQDILEMKEWIDVKERMPENYTTVIAYDEQNVFPADYEDEFFRAVNEYSHRYFSITKWMPLPNPPQNP